MTILAGGVGTRFWPISTPSRPKQLLPLAGDRSLMRQTLDRITPSVPLARIRILTGERLGKLIREELPELEPDHFMIEPQAKGTAPVLAWAAFEIFRRDPTGVMASLHADHSINSGTAFRELLREITLLASRHQKLFTIGITPTRPETGYGYIRIGDRLGPVMNAYEVADFVEKPDRDTAREYLRRGGHLWNSGIFVWRVEVFLDQLREHTPELAELLPLLEDGNVEEYFERAPALSIDEGLLERSDHVAVAPANFQWDDVGAWDAVARSRPADAGGNVSVGDAVLSESENCITWSEDGTVVTFGVSDLVVVHYGDITLVLPRERAADLKQLVNSLPPHLRQPSTDV